MFLNDNLPPAIARSIKLTVLLGALLCCVMIAAIGIINWLVLEKINQQVKHLINETAVKTNLIYDMRLAARERNLHLAMSLLVTDPFIIDQQWNNFLEQGTLFLIAREKLKQFDLSKAEMDLLEKQRELSIDTVKLQYQLHEQQLAGEYSKAIDTLNEETLMQIKVFSVLDSILELHKKNNKVIINNIYQSQKKTQKVIGLLIVMIFSIIYLISAYLINKLSIQDRKIKNEEIKYNALIEGSIDGILVADKKHIIKCNNNALKLFNIASLDELNRIGLDFFSHLSEKQHNENEADFFDFINSAILENKKQFAWRFKNFQGDDFPADIELQSIELDNNEYIQIIIRDTSEREAARQALLDANKNLEIKVEQRTDELNKTNAKMVNLARSAGMSEVASGVLHNVGNVLNSVNVSASVLKTSNTTSKTGQIDKIANILKENSGNIDDYLQNDEAGKFLIPYIEQLSIKLANEKNEQEKELGELIRNIDHIKNIISMQQNYTSNVGMIEKVMSSEVANDAVNINISSINISNIKLNKQYDADIELSIDKHKLIQILVNLLSNAKHAVVNGKKTHKDIIFGIKTDKKNVIFYVKDNGIGISKEDQKRVFEFGFKKRTDGHGYGLHHSAIAAKELGGELMVESDGLGQGATFTLTIPLQQT